jgi:ribonuclease VapC
LIVDTSALVAVINEEPGSDQVFEKLSAPGPVIIPATCFLECTIVLARRFPDPVTVLAEFLLANGVEISPIQGEHAVAAADAFMRYGKGRHPAGLNFGDCMSYAVAKISGMPLLYVGDDFSQTDVQSA